MRYLFSVLIFFSALNSSAGIPDGTWQGILVQSGRKMEEGTLLYARFSVSGNTISGKMREEIYDTENYAIKQFNGSLKNGTITLRQTVVERKTKNSRLKWCLLNIELKYDSIKGYLEGTFESSDCKRTMGKVILFRSTYNWADGDQNELSHIWFKPFIREYNEGLSAPEIRKIERDNFVFEPIYFDYDKSDIRPEHYAFLDRLVKVVKGHSDLRVRVTGHTDSDGSDAYNDTLSQKRARAIIDYFVAKGLSPDRLEFDFKGEKQPADTNNTPEGKQRNRRVDFSFI